MTDSINALALAEGMPTTADPSAILTACRIRRERTRWDNIALATTISNMVLSGFSEKRRDPLDNLSAMFTEEELDALRAERARQEQLRMETMQIERLMRLRQ